MDVIKAELERKRKEREAAQGSAPGVTTKFFRRGDLMKIEEEKRKKEQERLDREKEEVRRRKAEEEAAAQDSLQARLAKAKEAAQRKNKGGGDGGGMGRHTSGDEGEEEEIHDEDKMEEGGEGDKKTKKGEADNDSAAEDKEQQALPASEVKKRLRSLGHPVTLFGENAEQRMARFRKAEKEDTTADHDFGLAGGHETRNIALQKRRREKGGGGEEEEDSNHHLIMGGKRKGKGRDGSSSEEESGGEEEEDENDDMSEGEGGGKRRKRGGETQGDGDKHKGEHHHHISKPMSDHKRIYKYFRGLIKEWEQDLNARSDEMKRSLQGKMDTKTQKQCKDYIRPLFKLCKAKEVPDGIRGNIIEMIDFCEEGEFVKAQQVYLRTAIGNSPWPIGLTMVGIHERTGREKISSSKVAHIMNNEMQRKYLTSVKRLMRYAQDKRPDVLPSKKFI